MASLGLGFEAFIHPPFPIEHSLAIARQIIRALESLPFGSMTPFSDRTESILAAERHEGYERHLESIWMNVKRFARPGGDYNIDGLVYQSDTWLLHIDQLYMPEEGWACIGFHGPAHLNATNSFRDVWKLVVAGGVSLLNLLRPRLATVNATGDLGARVKNFDLAKLPPVLTPWTFLAAGEWAPEKHDSLLTVPGARLTPVSGGTLFEVPDFLERPRREL